MKGLLNCFSRNFLAAWLLLQLAACQSAAPPPAMSRLHQGINGSALDFTFDPSAPLGAVEGSGANPDAVGIIDYGLATKVKQAFTLDEVKTAGRSLIFTDQTKEITWFALFGPEGGMANNFFRTYRIEWYSPSGRLYHQQKFKSGFWNETFAKTSLKLETPVKDPLIGRWRVRVWKRARLIDDRYFEIRHVG